ncbi:MAG: VIT1/CCC1 transporter family protein [Pseudomonadota bacterium]
MPADGGKRSIRDYLGEIVYGANDGIVTTFAIVSGFAGAGAESTAEIGALAVLLFGLANLFADASAMGMGAYLASRAEHELYRRRHRETEEEVRTHPGTARARLTEAFEERGLSTMDARQIADQLSRHPALMAEISLAQEESLTDPRHEHPRIKGTVTFLSFLSFGVIPLIPYFLSEPTQETFIASATATVSALILLGLLRWLVTGENLLKCIGETVLVGGISAIIAFGVGLMFR